MTDKKQQRRADQTKKNIYSVPKFISKEAKFVRLKSIFMIC